MLCNQQTALAAEGSFRFASLSQGTTLVVPQTPIFFSILRGLQPRRTDALFASEGSMDRRDILKLTGRAAAIVAPLGAVLPGHAVESSVRTRPAGPLDD